jgi:hypothetical protein
MWARSLAVVCAVALATLAGARVPVATRGADVDSKLEDAKSLVRDGRFAQAVAKLQGVVLRLEQRGEERARSARLGEAHLHLALAYLALRSCGSRTCGTGTSSTSRETGPRT